jgi:hypothetical protein
MRFVLTLIVVFLAAAAAQAQPSVSGTVTDKRTGVSIPAANVFFAQTTFGSTTDAGGVYSFSKFPAGTYVLTVSYVGYKPFQTVVTLEKDERKTIDIALEEDIKQLNEIVVKPGKSTRERDYRDFKHFFLGETRFAEHVVIKNPDDIHLYFDTESTILYAHSLKPIILENSLTGYRIHYQIQQFEFDARTQVLINHGIPRFENMKPSTAFQRRKWEKNRLDAYEGSFLHFSRAWHAGAWPENGFTVAQLYRIPNPKRPPDAVLKYHLNRLRNSMPVSQRSVSIGSDGINLGGDSLMYYMQLQRLPKEIDSVGTARFTGSEFNADTVTGLKQFTGMFHITHTKKEDRRFAALVGRPQQIGNQHSVLHVFNPVYVYKTGYTENIHDILLERYWSWSEKISSMLPLDYEPPPKK